MKKFKSFIVKEEQVEEASKKQEGKFHSSLDKLVHKTFGKSKEEMKKEEVEQIEEMDKSQPSSSRGAEGVPTGKKAKPSKTDKVKTDALKVLQKQYKKVKEEVELDEVAAWQRKEGKSESGGLNRKGIEPGLSMSASGENLLRKGLKTKQNVKPFEEAIGAGGEDATSMSDFNDNVLKQKGINIKTFKAKRPIG